MDFKERLMERNRSRYTKSEVKEGVTHNSGTLKEVHQNTLTTVASSVDIKKDGKSNKVTIETTLTMRNYPERKEKRKSNSKNDSVEQENISTEEAENVVPKESNCSIRQHTKSTLKRLGVLYSDDPSRLSSPIHKTEEKFLVEEQTVEPQPQRSATSTARSARLAALADTINHWEDDIKPHSAAEHSQRKSPTKNTAVGKHQPFKSSHQCEGNMKFIMPQRDLSRPNTECLSKQVSPRNKMFVKTSPNKYNNSENVGRSILKKPSDKIISPIKKNKNDESYMLDKAVIDALEAQGFSRSESQQRLLYNYKSGNNSNSPAKSPQPVSNLSPRKASPEKVKSPVKSISPIKERNVPNIVGYKAHDMGVVQTSDEDIAKPTMGVKQLRSPRKTGASGSVLDRAQRYEESTSPTKRARDPAELPLAERLALFERNAGAAVLPKAPFGMAVPINKLQSQIRSKSPDSKDVQRRQFKPPASSCINTGSNSSLHDRVVRFEMTENSTKDHMAKIIAERKKEIEMLKHRNNRNYVASAVNHEDFEPSAPPLSPPPPPPPMPSPPTTFYEDDSYEEDEDDEQYNPTHTSPEVKPEIVYPVLKEVKKFKISPPKPGRLYPCLSDMETESEVQESEVDDPDLRCSSTCTSASDLNSLGQDIVKLSKSSLKRSWPASEMSGHDEEMNDDMDSFLEEALNDDSGCSDDVPTPPKRTSIQSAKNSGSVPSTSFEYTHVDSQPFEQNQPLLHTVSFYRKQQNLALKPPSPVKHIHIDSLNCSDDSIERLEEELDRELKLVEQKINKLREELDIQQTYISQASQALNLCYSTIEFSGSTEQVEAEKLLLLATQRRQAAQHEIQRLQVEQTLRPKTPGNKTLTEKGSLTLSKITLPLRMDVIHQASKDDECYHIMCLVRSEERVLNTEVMCTPRALHSHNRLTFPNTLTIDNLYSDFKITLEVYTMKAPIKELIPHDVKYHINTSKKDASKLKLTPRKGKGDSRLLMPSVQSPGGPHAVRTSAFTSAGYVIFSLREIQRTQFTLNKNAYTSVLEGALHLRIDSEMSVDIEHRGFLTMFEDISGFGAWHRRWCLLKGDKLSYWKYPDDERKKIALDTIELASCTTQEVGPVPRDVCARANTFLLETTRPTKSSDTDSLVLYTNGNKTTIRHLLSADTKEERIQWCLHLNKALALIKAWGASTSK